MRIAQRQFSPFHPASFSMASWVALLLAFLLATHSFWCALGGSDCPDDLSPGSAQIAALRAPRTAAHQVVAAALTHTHPGFSDLCSATDETKNRAVSALTALPAPLLIWVALAFVVAALLLVIPVPRGALVFGRDGPVSVPPLHSRLVRASLPHRAPPALLF